MRFELMGPLFARQNTGERDKYRNLENLNQYFSAGTNNSYIRIRNLEYRNV